MAGSPNTSDPATVPPSVRSETTRAGASRHPLYDQAMRRWAEICLVTLLVWLDRTLAGRPAETFTPRPTEFTRPASRLDLLASVGADRLMHVEYETRPRGNLRARMLVYRGQIMEAHPGVRVTQHVIVLDGGDVAECAEQNDQLFLQLNPVYLRNLEPAEFLTDPESAVLAVLARGTPGARARYLAQALAVIRASHHPKAVDLLTIAESLARIHLDVAAIDQILKETLMEPELTWEDVVRESYFTRHLVGLSREEGQQDGAQAGRRRAFLALLRVRFGDQPQLQATATALLTRTDDEAMSAITAANDLSELLGA